jgi:ribonucleotide reductase alpha subunit
MRIKTIKISNEREHTYDLDVPEIHEYLIQCGTHNLITHNSSVMQGTTNGVEPITSLIIKKSSLEKTAIQIVPGIDKFSDNYLKKSDIKDNVGIIKINAVIAKWLDMASSFNLYYDSESYPEGNIPLSVILKDHLMATHYGLKTFYYCNSKKKQDSLAAAEKEQVNEYTDEQKRLLSKKYTDEEQRVIAEAEIIRSMMTDNEKNQRKLWGTSLTSFNQHDGYGYEDEGGCSGGACSL